MTVQLGPPTILKGRLLDAETGKPITHGKFALDDGRRLTVDAQGTVRGPRAIPDQPRSLPALPRLRAQAHPVRYDRAGRCQAGLEAAQGGEGRRPRRRRARQADTRRNRRAEDPSGSIFSGSALWERCSEDGRFSYDGKPLGRTGRLSARAPGYPDLEREDVVVFDASNPVQIDFILHRRPDQSPGGGRCRQADEPADRIGHGRRSRWQACGLGRGAVGPADQQRQRSRDEDRRPGDVSPARVARFRECPLRDGQGSRAELPHGRRRGRPPGEGRVEGRRDDPGAGRGRLGCGHQGGAGVPAGQ